MLLGEILRRIREARGMTQSDIHSLTGILPIHVSRFERGITLPTLVTIERLADALNVPVWALFYEEDGRTPPVLPPRLEDGFGNFHKSERALQQLRLLLSKMTSRNRKLLLMVADAMQREKQDHRNIFGTCPDLIEYLGGKNHETMSADTIKLGSTNMRIPTTKPTPRPPQPQVDGQSIQKKSQKQNG